MLKSNFKKLISFFLVLSLLFQDFSFLNENLKITTFADETTSYVTDNKSISDTLIKSKDSNGKFTSFVKEGDNLYIYDLVPYISDNKNVEIYGYNLVDSNGTVFQMRTESSESNVNVFLSDEQDSGKFYYGNWMKAKRWTVDYNSLKETLNSRVEYANFFDSDLCVYPIYYISGKEIDVLNYGDNTNGNYYDSIFGNNFSAIFSFKEIAKDSYGIYYKNLNLSEYQDNNQSWSVDINEPNKNTINDKAAQNTYNSIMPSVGVFNFNGSIFINPKEKFDIETEVDIKQDEVLKNYTCGNVFLTSSFDKKNTLTSSYSISKNLSTELSKLNDVLSFSQKIEKLNEEGKYKLSLSNIDFTNAEDNSIFNFSISSSLGNANKASCNEYNGDKYIIDKNRPKLNYTITLKDGYFYDKKGNPNYDYNLETGVLKPITGEIKSVNYKSVEFTTNAASAEINLTSNESDSEQNSGSFAYKYIITDITDTQTNPNPGKDITNFDDNDGKCICLLDPDGVKEFGKGNSMYGRETGQTTPYNHSIVTEIGPLANSQLPANEEINNALDFSSMDDGSVRVITIIVTDRVGNITVLDVKITKKTTTSSGAKASLTIDDSTVAQTTDINGDGIIDDNDKNSTNSFYYPIVNNNSVGTDKYGTYHTTDNNGNLDADKAKATINTTNSLYYIKKDTEGTLTAVGGYSSGNKIVGQNRLFFMANDGLFGRNTTSSNGNNFYFDTVNKEGESRPNGSPIDINGSYENYTNNDKSYLTTKDGVLYSDLTTEIGENIKVLDSNGEWNGDYVRPVDTILSTSTWMTDIGRASYKNDKNIYEQYYVDKGDWEDTVYLPGFMKAGDNRFYGAYKGNTTYSNYVNIRKHGDIVNPLVTADDYKLVWDGTWHFKYNINTIKSGDSDYVYAYNDNYSKATEFYRPNECKVGGTFVGVKSNKKINLNSNSKDVCKYQWQANNSSSTEAAAKSSFNSGKWLTRFTGYGENVTKYGFTGKSLFSIRNGVLGKYNDATVWKTNANTNIANYTTTEFDLLLSERYFRKVDNKKVGNNTFKVYQYHISEGFLKTTKPGDSTSNFGLMNRKNKDKDGYLITDATYTFAREGYISFVDFAGKSKDDGQFSDEINIAVDGQAPELTVKKNNTVLAPLSTLQLGTKYSLSSVDKNSGIANVVVYGLHKTSVESYDLKLKDSNKKEVEATKISLTNDNSEFSTNEIRYEYYNGYFTIPNNGTCNDVYEVHVITTDNVGNSKTYIYKLNNNSTTYARANINLFDNNGKALYENDGIYYAQLIPDNTKSNVKVSVKDGAYKDVDILSGRGFRLNVTNLNNGKNNNLQLNKNSTTCYTEASNINPSNAVLNYRIDKISNASMSKINSDSPRILKGDYLMHFYAEHRYEFYTMAYAKNNSNTSSAKSKILTLQIDGTAPTVKVKPVTSGSEITSHYENTDDALASNDRLELNKSYTFTIEDPEANSKYNNTMSGLYNIAVYVVGSVNKTYGDSEVLVYSAYDEIGYDEEYDDFKLAHYQTSHAITWNINSKFLNREELSALKNIIGLKFECTDNVGNTSVYCYAFDDKADINVDNFSVKDNNTSKATSLDERSFDDYTDSVWYTSGNYYWVKKDTDITFNEQSTATYYDYGDMNTFLNITSNVIKYNRIRLAKINEVAKDEKEDYLGLNNGYYDGKIFKTKESETTDYYISGRSNKSSTKNTTVTKLLSNSTENKHIAESTSVIQFKNHEDCLTLEPNARAVVAFGGIENYKNYFTKDTNDGKCYKQTNTAEDLLSKSINVKVDGVAPTITLTDNEDNTEYTAECTIESKDITLNFKDDHSGFHHMIMKKWDEEKGVYIYCDVDSISPIVTPLDSSMNLDGSTYKVNFKNLRGGKYEITAVDNVNNISKYEFTIISPAEIVAETPTVTEGNKYEGNEKTWVNPYVPTNISSYSTAYIVNANGNEVESNNSNFFVLKNQMVFEKVENNENSGVGYFSYKRQNNKYVENSNLTNGLSQSHYTLNSSSASGLNPYYINSTGYLGKIDNVDSDINEYNIYLNATANITSYSNTSGKAKIYTDGVKPTIEGATKGFDSTLGGLTYSFSTKDIGSGLKENTFALYEVTGVDSNGYATFSEIKATGDNNIVYHFINNTQENGGDYGRNYVLVSQDNVGNWSYRYVYYVAPGETDISGKTQYPILTSNLENDYSNNVVYDTNVAIDAPIVIEGEKVEISDIKAIDVKYTNPDTNDLWIRDSGSILYTSKSNYTDEYFKIAFNNLTINYTSVLNSANNLSIDVVNGYHNKYVGKNSDGLVNTILAPNGTHVVTTSDEDKAVFNNFNNNSNTYNENQCTSEFSFKTVPTSGYLDFIPHSTSELSLISLAESDNDSNFITRINIDKIAPKIYAPVITDESNSDTVTYKLSINDKNTTDAQSGIYTTVITNASGDVVMSKTIDKASTNTMNVTYKGITLERGVSYTITVTDNVGNQSVRYFTSPSKDKPTIELTEFTLLPTTSGKFIEYSGEDSYWVNAKNTTITNTLTGQTYVNGVAGSTTEFKHTNNEVKVYDENSSLIATLSGNRLNTSGTLGNFTDKSSIVSNFSTAIMSMTKGTDTSMTTDDSIITNNTSLSNLDINDENSYPVYTFIPTVSAVYNGETLGSATGNGLTVHLDGISSKTTWNSPWNNDIAYENYATISGTKYTSDAAPEFNVVVTDGAGSGIKLFTLYEWGSPNSTARKSVRKTSGNETTYTYNLTDGDGVYQLHTGVDDNVGNRGTSTYKFTYDPNAPIITVNGIDATASENPIMIDYEDRANVNISFTESLSSDSGINNYKITAPNDTSNVFYEFNNSSGRLTSTDTTFDLNKALDAGYTEVWVLASDNVANKSCSKGQTITDDNPPHITIRLKDIEVQVTYKDIYSEGALATVNTDSSYIITEKYDFIKRNNEGLNVGMARDNDGIARVDIYSSPDYYISPDITDSSLGRIVTANDNNYSFRGYVFDASNSTTFKEKSNNGIITADYEPNDREAIMTLVNQAKSNDSTYEKTSTDDKDVYKITLYTSYNEFSVITGEDQYYTKKSLEGLTAADITSKVTSSDREDGDNTSSLTFSDVDLDFLKKYPDDEYGCIEFTATIIDSVGNKTTETYKVYVMGICLPDEEYVRFISEKYFMDDEGNFVEPADGGVEANSVWRTSEYATALKETLKTANNEHNRERREFNYLSTHRFKYLDGTGLFESNTFVSEYYFSTNEIREIRAAYVDTFKDDDGNLKNEYTTKSGYKTAFFNFADDNVIKHRSTIETGMIGSDKEASIESVKSTNTDDSDIPLNVSVGIENITSSTVNANSNVKIIATAEGGTGKYTYTFKIINNANNSVYTGSSSSWENVSSNSVLWSIGSISGERTIEVTVKDSDGTTATTSIVVSVVK